MSEPWDKDISAMKLSDLEKNGLQVYRNYQRAFDSHAEQQLAKEIDAKEFDTSSLTRVVGLLSAEEPRFLPVIACAYADDILKDMFKTEVPEETPGGTSALFGPYGPMSNLFNRLQLAFVFDILSADLVRDVDRVRRARNDLSHTWDIGLLKDFFLKGTAADLYPIDTLLAEQPERLPWLSEPIPPLKAFRVRLIWMVARLTYETRCYPLAKRARLRPQSALYGPNAPKLLSVVSGAALDMSKKVIEAPSS